MIYVVRGRIITAKTGHNGKTGQLVYRGQLACYVND